MDNNCNNWSIYIHRNKINNKAYIGISKNKPSKRWGRNGNGYKNQYFYRAIKKYGWDNFEHILWAEELTKNKACKIEQLLIALFKTNNREYGYNISSGGESGAEGIPWTNKRKEQLSQKLKGRELSDEWKEKLRQSHIGKTHSEDTKKKLSEQRQGKLNNFYGKHHTEESRKIMSEKAKNRDKSTININGLKHGKEYWTEETYRKLSEKSQGENNGYAKLTEENVIDILTMIKNKILYSEIRNKYNISYTEISRIKHRKRWEYLYDKYPELYT